MANNTTFNETAERIAATRKENQKAARDSHHVLARRKVEEHNDSLALAKELDLPL